MEQAALAVALRRYGVETRNRRGASEEDVAAAVAERDDTDRPGQQGTCGCQQGCSVPGPGWTVPEAAVEWLTAR